ncbi:Bacteriophage replication protein O [Halomonas sp. THAF12]|uniref:replication protein n=1 Tax=Halomonas sp. THAF12 TaxID=2587849 RepID=UPI0012688F86|nr:replication protein [Halomonas sp. THAF12]QFT84943.1 Bacteriophage replication protein O [Halomonas sp. THAF12]
MSNLAYLPGHEPEPASADAPRGPQLENGYVRISHEVMRALGRARLRGSEYPVVLFVIDETWGWHVKHKILRTNYIAKELGIPVTKASEAVAELIRRGVLYRVGDSQGPIGFNKHHDQWKAKSSASKTVKRPDPKSGMIHENGERIVHENGEQTTHQNRESNKDRKDRKDITPLSDQSDGEVQHDLEKLFDRFWQAGMRKDGKIPAKEKFFRLVSGHADPEGFTEGLINDIKIRLEAGVPGFSKLHPKTYLNQKRWLDDLPERCPHAAIIQAWNEELPAHIEKLSAEDWTPESNAFQTLAASWETFKTKPRAATGKPVFTEEAEGVAFYREVFRRLAKVARIQTEDAARWCRLSWVAQKDVTVQIFKGEIA